MPPKSPKTATPYPDAGELSAAILGWMANEPEMLSRFLALTGITAGDLRGMAASSALATALAEFLLAHEPSLMAFSQASGLPPEAVESAWQKLSGPHYGGTGA
jgi:hypothetical protein